MNTKHIDIKRWILIAVFLIGFIVQVEEVVRAQSPTVTLTYAYNDQQLANVDDYMRRLSEYTSIVFKPARDEKNADITWTVGNPYKPVDDNSNEMRTKAVQHQPLSFYGAKKFIGQQIFTKGQRIGIQSLDYLELNKEMMFDNEGVEIYVYNQSEQMMDDYRSGQLDFFVSSDNRYTFIENDRIIAYREYVSYATHESSYMVLDTNIDYDGDMILNQINDGITRVQNSESVKSLFMKNKETQALEDFYQLLTPEEMDYLATKSTIYAYIPETIPYFYSNGKDYYGYVYETLISLEALLETPIVFQTQIDENTDLIWGNQSEPPFSLNTIPFLQENFVMVGMYTQSAYKSLDRLYNQRIGSFNSSQISNRLAEKLPGANITYYDSMDQMVQGLYNQTIDVAMMSLWDMNYLEKAMDKKALSLRFVTPFFESSSFFLADRNQALLQVMNKGIQVLDTDAIELRSLENVPNVLYRRNNLIIASSFLGLLLAVVMMIVGIRLYMNNRRNKELRYLYAHDYLTLLPNKNGLMQHMSKRMKSNESGTLILLDVNGFKEINNRIGHKGGDEILLAIAQKFMGIINESRVLGRVGGDEFLLVLFGESREEEQEVIDILRRSIEELQEEQPRLTQFDMSIGVVQFPEHGRDYDSLYSKARYAIDYIKQHNIKPQALNFTQNLYDVYLEEQKLLSQIEKGIATEAFELYIQPQIHLETQTIIGGEMLIRWNHPDKGMLYPGAFIDIAEKNGKITMIDYYVLDKACAFMGKMQKNGYYFKVSVNMTAQTFTSHDMIGRLNTCIQSYSVNPHFLIIEVTEDMGFENLNKANSVFEELKEIGVKVALDDFGKGYSSLSYLEKLNIDLLKIDKYFIDNIHLRKKSREVFDVICGLAKIMKIDIIVEGVECIEQVDIIRGHSDIVVQGYYYSKPITLTEFIKVYDKRSINESIDFL